MTEKPLRFIAKSIPFDKWQEFYKPKDEWLRFVKAYNDKPSWLNEYEVPDAEIWYYYFKLGIIYAKDEKESI